MTDSPEPSEQGGPFEGHPYDDWEHREAARKVPAKYASQVYVQPLADGMIRINFGEAEPDQLEPSYHSALVLSARNGLELAAIIDRVSRVVLGPMTPPPIVRTNIPQPETQPEESGGE